MTTREITLGLIFVFITEKPFIALTSEKQSEAKKALNSLISDSSEISDLSEHEEPENQPETITSASRSTCSASGELGRVLIFLYQNPLHLNHGLFPKKHSCS